MSVAEPEKSEDFTEQKQEIMDDDSAQEVDAAEVKAETVEDRIATAVSAGICIRNGCKNKAITNVEWEDEFCSNECAVCHCKDIFSSWVASKNQTS